MNKIDLSWFRAFKVNIKYIKQYGSTNDMEATKILLIQFQTTEFNKLWLDINKFSYNNQF